MSTDYSIYILSWKERMLCVLKAAMLVGVIDYLCYRTIWLAVGIVPVTVFIGIREKRIRAKKRRKKLNEEFKDMLLSLNVALQAGYSVENAITTCHKDLEKLYTKKADIMQELVYMEVQLKVSVPVESLFLDFGKRSKVEDIESFSEIFAAAKRTGGDLNRVIEKTANMLSDKIEVRKEIETTLAAKKSEQLIMSITPFAIILYMQITSPGFLDVLYGNFFGMAVMTICLCIYFTAYWLGCKVVNIEV